ncbi:MAG: 23S rRNA (guanosine(2251)-2'-O)-methyltransferase RlmB [Azoarcus sp.]|jgi:23S rRNA (guanosine2251-2'-O)-methyltransferase|nr:23S rRNA (guanosine(2251)-2'-O)-methyltransferase RlmB [Azoarcus sp.]
MAEPHGPPTGKPSGKEKTREAETRRAAPPRRNRRGGGCGKGTKSEGAAGAPARTPSRLIHGFHAVLGRLRREPDTVFELYLSALRNDARAREIHKLAEAAGVKTTQVENERLDGMAGTRRHQGVIARVDARQRSLALADILESLADPVLLLVLDGVQDPHNLGACLRVADAAGVHAVIAPKDRAVGLNATAVKVASGAADTVPYITVTNLARALEQIKKAGIWVVGAAGEAEKSIFDVDQKAAIAWVLGSEGEGLRRLTRAACDELARIPMLGSVESLNVSVASGICLFEACRQRGA